MQEKIEIKYGKAQIKISGRIITSMTVMGLILLCILMVWMGTS